MTDDAAQLLATIDSDAQDVPTEPVLREHLARALADSPPRTLLPASVRFFASDPSQRVRWAGPGQLLVEGRSARGLSAPSWVQLELDGHRLPRLCLRGGATALATAQQLCAALPFGYTGRLDVPAHPEVEVTLSILRAR